MDGLGLLQNTAQIRFIMRKVASKDVDSNELNIPAIAIFSCIDEDLACNVSCFKN